MEIRWTPKARRTYFDIIDYLEKAWTVKEVQNFINEVDHLLEQIKHNPEMFEESRKKKNVRKGLVTRQNTLYYRRRRNFS
jgi:plasmid stabilization system protein ParE